MIDPPDFPRVGRCITIPIKEEEVVKSCRDCARWFGNDIELSISCPRKGGGIVAGDQICKRFLFNYKEESMSKKEFRDLTKQVKILKGKLENHIDGPGQYIGVATAQGNVRGTVDVIFPGYEKKKAKRPWPVDGDYYYYIYDGQICKSTWLDNYTDREHRAFGNFYKHRHEAEKRITEIPWPGPEKKKEKQKKSFPVEGDGYFYIGTVGSILASKWRRVDVHLDRLAAGNCFESYDEAVRERDHQILRYRERKAAGEAWRSADVPVDHYKYYIYINQNEKKINARGMNFDFNTQLGAVYFPSVQAGKDFVVKNRELIDKIYHTKKYTIDGEPDEITITFD